MFTLLRHPLSHVVLATAFLAGCGAIHDAAYNHDQTCQQQGWKPDTQGYSECIEKLKQENSDEEVPGSFLDGGWWIGTWF